MFNKGLLVWEPATAASPVKAELTSVCVGNVLVRVYEARRIQATLTVPWWKGGKKYWMTLCVCVEEEEPREIRK